MRKMLGIAALSAALAVGYGATQEKPAADKYDVPTQITARFSAGRTPFVTSTGLEEVVQTEDIDFTKPFDLVTDRYRLVRDEDNIVSTAFGKYVGSLPIKFLLFDWDAGSTPDAERAKAALAILENDKAIKDVTVRLGHNRALYDTWRLFTDEKITERNNIVARIVLGLPTTLITEPLAEISRSDYYNPITQTIALYSNIEAVGAHELGHHKDYQRWSNDWAYAFTSAFPPVKLYKEYVASRNANDMLPGDDQGQVARYLLPAFLTYLVAGGALSRKILQKRTLTVHDDIHPLEDRVTKRFELLHFLHDKFRPHADVDKMKEHERPKVHYAETARHFAHQNIMLLSAIGAYSAASDIGQWAATGAFAAGMLASDYICDVVGDRLMPYTHERQCMMTRRVAKKAYDAAGYVANAIRLRYSHPPSIELPQIE